MAQLQRLLAEVKSEAHSRHSEDARCRKGLTTLSRAKPSYMEVSRHHEDMPTGTCPVYGCQQRLCSWAVGPPRHILPYSPRCLVTSLTSASELHFQKVKIACNYTAFHSLQALL